MIQLEPRELKGWQGTACFPYQGWSGHPHIRQESPKKGPQLTDEELRQVAHIASIGAVKYAELSTARTKNYNFDVEQMVSFNGDNREGPSH